MLKLPGKTGEIPNPLENGVFADNPDQKVKYIIEEDGQPGRLYIVSKIERGTDETGNPTISLIEHCNCLKKDC